METDSIIKTQDIKKLQEEFDDFKKEIHSKLLNNDNVKNTLNKTELIEYSNEDGFVKPLESESHQEQYDYHLYQNIPTCLGDYDDDSFQNSCEKLDEKTQNFEFHKIHNEVLKIVNNFKKKNRNYKDKTFNCLLYMFTTDEFLSYEKTSLFNSLDDESKRCFKITIKHRLADEVIGKRKKLSQPINVYIDRNLIPSLPAGINSYAEFEKTSEFNFLSQEEKMGIKKAISVENMN